MTTDPKPPVETTLVSPAGPNPQEVTRPGQPGTDISNAPASDPENTVGREKERVLNLPNEIKRKEETAANDAEIKKAEEKFSDATSVHVKPVEELKKESNSSLAMANPARVEEDAEAEEVLAAAKKRLEKFNNQEANIPLSDEYWALMNRYRALKPNL